jgi:hypothetical protein
MSYTCGWEWIGVEMLIGAGLGNLLAGSAYRHGRSAIPSATNKTFPDIPLVIMVFPKLTKHNRRSATSTLKRS